MLACCCFCSRICNIFYCCINNSFSQLPQRPLTNHPVSQCAEDWAARQLADRVLHRSVIPWEEAGSRVGSSRLPHLSRMSPSRCAPPRRQSASTAPPPTVLSLWVPTGGATSEPLKIAQWNGTASLAGAAWGPPAGSGSRSDSNVPRVR